MTVRRFVGATARDCLRRAKEVLGADAVVVSNRAVEGGVEIVAMSPESLDAISHQLRPTDAVPPPVPATQVDTPYDSDYTVSLSVARREAARQPGPPLVRPWEPQRLDGAGRQESIPVMPAAPKPALATPSPRPPGAKAERAAVPPLTDRLTPPPHETQPTPAERTRQASLKESGLQTAQLIDEVRIIKELLERQLAGFADRKSVV